MRKLFLMFAALSPFMAACDTIDSHNARLAQSELVGMPRAEVYACAGLPNRTQMLGGAEYDTWDYEPYTPDSSLSASLPLLGGVALGSSGDCKATAIFRDDKLSEIDYAGDTGGILGHVAECVNIVNHCQDGAREATGKY